MVMKTLLKYTIAVALLSLCFYAIYKFVNFEAAVCIFFAGVIAGLALIEGKLTKNK